MPAFLPQVKEIVFQAIDILSKKLENLLAGVQQAMEEPPEAMEQGWA
jgi:hypothetical protein